VTLGDGARPRLALRASLSALAVTIVAWAGPIQAIGQPSVLLFGATLEETRALVVESAHGHGWTVAAVDPEEAAFEQVLDPGEWADEDVAARVIRITARLHSEAEGVRVLLRAQEIEEPGSETEWTTDVTDRYWDNLTNALSRLRMAWERSEPNAHRQPPFAGTPAPISVAEPGEIGTWAYYAEDYASRAGCALADRGARLIASGPEWEHHRVDCAGGETLDVMCRYGECTGVR
jgi:hypothetical protein